MPHHHYIFLSLLLLLAVSTAALPSLLPNCNQTFSCGNLQNLSYPFTGGPRPSYCGPPQFHLTCADDKKTILNSSNSLSYRVMKLDPTLKSLILTRSDLFQDDDDSCSLLNSTSSSLDPTVYALSSNDNIYLTVFYDCSLFAEKFETWVTNSFSCRSNGTVREAYYVAGEGFSAPEEVGCNATVTVPVVNTAIYSNGSKIEEVLSEGFNVSYKVPYGDDCGKCEKIGGFCGFDKESNEPICICNDIICDIPGSDSGKQLKLGFAIGIPLFVGTFLGSILVVYLLKRRKKTLEGKNKEHQMPSSNGFTNSSANLIRSIPSNPSSNFDLEKGSLYFRAKIFQFTELVEATENFNPSKELGDGGFGTVYYGKLKDGRVVAVKRLYENNFKRAEQFMNEIEILSRLRHPNLVTLYGCTSRQSRELVLVYEYVPNGTIADHIHENRQKSNFITWPIRLRIAVETATALTYLHASDVIHRDVKSNNILLDHNFSVKVADFGMSRLFPTNVTHVSTAPQGTPGYVDPDYYQCYQLTDKSDVFSFGVVLVELISSKEAVDTCRSRHDINLSNMAVSRIQNHALHELVDPRLGFETDYDTRRKITSVAELAFRCLQQETDLRPSMSEVLEALREIKNEELGVTKAEVMDIVADEVVLLKSFSPPHSPDSVSDDKK